jgi:hypothetical protein
MRACIRLQQLFLFHLDSHNPTPTTLHPQPYTHNPTPTTLHPQPYTHNPTHNPTPTTLHTTLHYNPTLQPYTTTLHYNPTLQPATHKLILFCNRSKIYKSRTFSWIAQRTLKAHTVCSGFAFDLLQQLRGIHTRPITLLKNLCSRRILYVQLVSEIGDVASSDMKHLRLEESEESRTGRSRPHCLLIGGKHFAQSTLS